MSKDVKRSYVEGRHGQMHVRAAGSRESVQPPILFIHMSPMTGRIFEKIMAVLGRDRLCIAFDTPGFGMSDAPPSPPEIEDYAADLLAGLDAMGVTGPIDVMGYHTGSLISTALAVAAPERIRRVLMVSAPIIPAEERAAFTTYYGHRKPDADGNHLVRRWTGFLYHHLRPGVTIEEVSDVFRDALMGGENEWWGHRAAFAFDLADTLSRVQQPVLILNPGDDLDVQTRRAKGLAKNSFIHEVSGWGHGFLDHHTADAEAVIRSYLDAAAGAEFAALPLPESAAQPRYPALVGSFPAGVDPTTTA